MKKHPNRATCCPKGEDYICWMTGLEADDDDRRDGYYISLHCGYPDPVYELVTVCPFCGAVPQRPKCAYKDCSNLVMLGAETNVPLSVCQECFDKGRPWSQE